jgi:iron only hydrogenase large subunit-like protein
MLGAAAKTAVARQAGIDPAKMFVVSVMPCTAKKYERDREEFNSASRYWAENGRDGGSYPDVDAVLTTRECAKLLKLNGIDLAALAESEPDDFLSEYTGAGTIFGRTGGVMTAALRTAYELATGTALGDIELTALGSPEGIKTAEIDADGTIIRVAVASGLRNARKICEDIKNGGEFSKYSFIEIMSCPGGCVGGGGQTITTNKLKTADRAKGLNSEDKNLASRKSHENASVNALYDNFYGKPCSELSHKLLHTRHHGRD